MAPICLRRWSGASKTWPGASSKSFPSLQATSEPSDTAMHEHSLMKDLMAKIAAVVKESQARRAVAVEVWLGALSHMSPEHFTEHYEESAKGTVAEGAELHITLSDDIHDPNAQQILLRNIEVED